MTHGKKAVLSGGVPGFDIFGDVHGRLDTLQKAFRALSYRREDAFLWIPPKGRKAIFLGDLIDRGSFSVETVLTVRKMAREGVASCVMGNHEYNAACWFLQRADGGFLRAHSEENRRQLAMFLEGAGENSRLCAKLAGWFMHLPLWIDFGPFLCCHACPPESAVERCRGLLDPQCRPRGIGFFLASRSRGSAAWSLVNRVLRGPALPLPDGITFFDRYGIERSLVRIMWWSRSSRRTWRELSVAGGADLSHLPATDIPAGMLCGFQPVKPSFFGHYGLPPENPGAGLSPMAACLDFRAGTGGPLAVYRWNEGDEGILPGRTQLIFPDPA